MTMPFQQLVYPVKFILLACWLVLVPKECFFFLHLRITCYPLLSNLVIICLLHTPSVACLLNSWNLFPLSSYHVFGLLCT